MVETLVCWYVQVNPSFQGGEHRRKKQKTEKEGAPPKMVPRLKPTWVESNPSVGDSDSESVSERRAKGVSEDEAVLLLRFCHWDVAAFNEAPEETETGEGLPPEAEGVFPHLFS